MLFCVFVFLLLTLSIPVLFLGLEVVCAILPLKKQDWNIPDETRPATTVLVPAHNEERGIESTLKAIKSEMQPQDQLPVQSISSR